MKNNLNNCVYYEKCNLANTVKCCNICPLFVKINIALNYLNVPKIYRELSINSIDVDYPFVTRIKTYVTIFERIEKENSGLYLYNEITGTGKTFIASIIANEYLKWKIKNTYNEPYQYYAKFINFAEWVNLFNKQFRLSDDITSQEYYKLKECMNSINLLILDDVGTRTMTEAFLNELYEIINNRWINGKLTIITSNLTLDNLRNFIGERIYSRIKDLTTEIKIEGKDWRVCNESI